MKLYTQTPNRLGRPLIRELGGWAGGMFEMRRVAKTTMIRNACHLIRVVAI